MEQPLNKTGQGGYWRKLMSGTVDKSLFFPNSNFGIKEKMRLFKKYVCIVNLETNNYCNRKCLYCPLAISDRGTKTNIEPGLFSKIVQELKEIKYWSTISLSLYNEPLTDPELPSRISEMRTALPDAVIEFNTNGNYLNRNMLDKLVVSGITSMFITCHISRTNSLD